MGCVGSVDADVGKKSDTDYVRTVLLEEVLRREPGHDGIDNLMLTPGPVPPFLSEALQSFEMRTHLLRADRVVNHHLTSEYVKAGGYGAESIVFHGTSIRAADRIVNEGFSSRFGVWSSGVYVYRGSSACRSATSHARIRDPKASSCALIACRVRLTSGDYTSFMDICRITDPRRLLPIAVLLMSLDKVETGDILTSTAKPFAAHASTEAKVDRKDPMPFVGAQAEKSLVAPPTPHPAVLTAAATIAQYDAALITRSPIPLPAFG